MRSFRERGLYLVLLISHKKSWGQAIEEVTLGD